MPKKIPHLGDTKHCSRCKQYKPFASFRKNTDRWDGLNGMCRECCSNYDAKWVRTDAGMRLRKANNRRWRLKLRLEILCHYGLSCACCGDGVLDHLTIDHIRGGGKEHKRETNCGSIYYWLRMNKYPEGFRTLCYNCNSSLGQYGYCPHRHHGNGSKKHWRWLKKLEALSAYSPDGPRCKRCLENHPEFLCLDHVNDDGAERRKETGYGYNAYVWYRKHGYPPGLQVLCHNCNAGKQLERLRKNDVIVPRQTKPSMALAG